MFATRANSRQNSRTNTVAITVFAIAYVALMGFLFVPRSWLSQDHSAMARTTAQLSVDRPLSN